MRRLKTKKSARGSAARIAKRIQRREWLRRKNGQRIKPPRFVRLNRRHQSVLDGTVVFQGLRVQGTLDRELGFRLPLSSVEQLLGVNGDDLLLLIARLRDDGILREGLDYATPDHQGVIVTKPGLTRLQLAVRKGGEHG